jgi:VanZ family protein
VLGPVGLHYVPIDLDEAVQRFLSVRFVSHGSDQRADWIANMLMPIPLAFLVNSAFSYGGDKVRNAMGSVFTALICIALVLAVKFAQLYFPPRTVTLNYIAAQTIGVMLGIGLFWTSHTRLMPRLAALFEDGDGLTIVLGVYFAWLMLYFLAPFDFALSLGDLAGRALELPGLLGQTPGEDRSAPFQILVTLAEILATVPLGMFLAVRGRHRSTFGLAMRAVGLIFLVFVLQLFILSAVPMLISLIYRLVGVVIGVRLMTALRGKDLRKRHYQFSRYVPIAIPIYILLVMFVNGLLTSEWGTFDQGWDAMDGRQFLPFWNSYIVTKARATESFVVMSLIYAPIGIMVWLRRGFWSSGGKFSAFLAFLLASLMEFGRLMKPGLRPDITDAVIAAVAAAVAFKAMPYLWRMFEREAARSGTLDSYIEQLRATDPQYAEQAVEPEEPYAPAH